MAESLVGHLRSLLASIEAGPSGLSRGRGTSNASVVDPTNVTTSANDGIPWMVLDDVDHGLHWPDDPNLPWVHI